MYISAIQVTFNHTFTLKKHLLISLLLLSSLLCTAESLEIPGKIKGCKEQIIKHAGYTVSYNSDLLIPNWVAYSLTADKANGTVKRSGDFIPDPLVKGATAVSSDYTGSGYDRGHMALDCLSVLFELLAELATLAPASTAATLLGLPLKTFSL